MHVLIFQANVFATSKTFLGLRATIVCVLVPVFILNDLLTELARLWPESTPRKMAIDFLLVEFDLTVLTDDLSVRFFVMFIFFCLGNNVTTLLALVVVPGASHLMEAKLAQFDVFHAGATLFARLITCRYLVSFHYFNIQNLD